MNTHEYGRLSHRQEKWLKGILDKHTYHNLHQMQYITTANQGEDVFMAHISYTDGSPYVVHTHNYDNAYIAHCEALEILKDERWENEHSYTVQDLEDECIIDNRDNRDNRDDEDEIEDYDYFDGEEV